jgi:hypothetical protein
MYYEIFTLHGLDWFDYWSGSDKLEAKKIFNDLINAGNSVKVVECRDLNSGKTWLED